MLYNANEIYENRKKSFNESIPVKDFWNIQTPSCDPPPCFSEICKTPVTLYGNNLQHNPPDQDKPFSEPFI